MMHNKIQIVLCSSTQQYIIWLSKETGKHYRLPTEAEWEYVARAGGSTKYSWGNDKETKLANCEGCGSPWDNKKTAPVSSFPPNNFGLYDTHGNVWEWVQDWYSTDYYRHSPSQDPKGARSGRNRVFRGGGWDHGNGGIRAAFRGKSSQGDHYQDIGFRIMRER